MLAGPPPPAWYWCWLWLWLWLWLWGRLSGWLWVRLSGWLSAVTRPGFFCHATLLSALRQMATARAHDAAVLITEGTRDVPQSQAAFRGQRSVGPAISPENQCFSR